MEGHVPTVKLNNGLGIPQLGFGVFKIPPADTVSAVMTALAAGYRHIDTAQMYGNEKQVGEAIARAGLSRDSVFVTSKLDNDKQTFDAALRSFDRSLADLGFEEMDLFLVHWPLPTVRDFVVVWRALERVYAEGRTRAIGVSNFQVHHLQRLLDETDVVPAVNQIEAHPYFSQERLRAFGEERSIATEAWAPIARGMVAKDPAVIELAERIGRTPAQVVLRWHIQLGNIVFPKSVRPERIRENAELFDFGLSDADMEAISGFDRGQRLGPDPDTFDFVPG